MSFKLIIDEPALELISEKLAGQPVYAGPDGDLLTPGIVNILSDEETSDQWQPGNERTKQLVLGVEACRDVLFYLDQYLEPKTRKRAMHRMTIPICSLIDVIKKLLAVTNDPQSRHIRESSWPSSDLETYTKLTRRLKKINGQTPIRRVRNQLSAHLDPDIFVKKAPSLKPDDILVPLGDCIVLLMLSINYPSEWFQWIRPIGILEDKKHLAVETMYSYPICVRWITDLEGHIKDVGSVVLAADPRHELQEQLIETVSSYNKMIEIGSDQLSPIYTIPTDELRNRIGPIPTCKVKDARQSSLSRMALT
jgi:hypothetical protein